MLECPANYFGKGENYNLGEDPEELREFEQKFAAWEAAHPNDPTGELALNAAKAAGEKTSSPVVSKVAEVIPAMPIDSDTAQLKLELPTEYIRKLKSYATLKRRRPRDLLMKWIDDNCKI